jgi:hypothetical protein
MTNDNKLNRKDFLRLCGRGAGALVLGGLAAGLGIKNARKAGDGAQRFSVSAQCALCGYCAVPGALSRSASCLGNARQPAGQLTKPDREEVAHGRG